MTLQDIYQQVRLCFDEEAANDAAFLSASAGDCASMNNIIKSKIGDALRWICLYAPAEQLSGGASSTDGNISIIEDVAGDHVPASGRIPLGENFIRLVRVRCSNWHRAVMGDSLLREDSDEYLQLYDEYGATATNDRPQAAIIEKKVKEVEVWPHYTTASYELTKLVMPSQSSLADIDASGLDVPQLLQSSFLYYLAFLVLSAYEDTRSARMLEIAKMNLGLSDDKQRV